MLYVIDVSIDLQILLKYFLLRCLTMYDLTITYAFH